MTAPATDETDLLRRAKAGDQQALATLFARYRDRLRKMVRLRLDRRLYGRIDTSDVLQDAYLEVARRFPEYAASPTVPFFIWLRSLTGQRLVDVHRRNYHAMPTTVVLTFDQPLDPGSAEDVRNYVILDPSGHRIRINRAVLDPTRLTVTLHPAQRISIHHPYQLIVNGAGPGAVRNMSGQPLDSVDAGQPGSSDHVVLTWRQLVLGDVSKAFRIRYGIVPKGPRAKIPSGVSSPKAAWGNRGAKTGPRAKLLAIESMAANGPFER